MIEEVGNFTSTHFDKKKYDAEYIKRNYRRIVLEVRPELKELAEKKAKVRGLSLTKYISNLILNDE